MGETYKQLSGEERVQIYHWHANGKSARWIGAALGRQASTIIREMRRNSKRSKQWRGGYDPIRAQALALRRRRWDGRFKLARQPELRGLVRDKLAMGWSPEQIAGWLAQNQPTTTISHESIYRFIYHRSNQRDPWHHLLARRKSFRRRKARYTGCAVLRIKDRVSIHQRPAHIASRAEPGHWESDSILFRRSGQALLVAQERVSRFIFLGRPSLKTDQTISCLADWLTPLPAGLRRSLTQDNGNEFSHHYLLRDKLGLLTFFCDPSCPWQKGGIENMNGRLRRALPRTTDLSALSLDDLQAIAARYNNTPRKCLGFKTPAEVFSSLLSTVALQA